MYKRQTEEEPLLLPTYYLPLASYYYLLPTSTDHYLLHTYYYLLPTTYNILPNQPNTDREPQKTTDGANAKAHKHPHPHNQAKPLTNESDAALDRVGGHPWHMQIAMTIVWAIQVAMYHDAYEGYHEQLLGHQG